MKRQDYKPENYNLNTQNYKGIPIRLILYTEQHFARLKAKRFVINNTNQNLWIPNSCLTEDGTLLPGKNLDFIFRKATRKLDLAGVKHPY